MSQLADYESRLREGLGLTRRPIGVAYVDEAPTGVARFDGSEPSSCSFWRLAAAGEVFATVASDHWNCPIGAYTQNIPLPPERAPELEQTLGLMASLGYIRMEEVPGIPRLPRTPGQIVFGPLGELPVAPSAVLLAAKPGRLMLLQEAAARAGAAAPLPPLGRPTCMALPAALANGVVLSAGCIGNRVYTDVGDDELYAVIPGASLDAVLAELDTIAQANMALEDYHEQRRAQLSSR